jgi:hypothetical protein
MYWRYFMWNFAGRQNDVQADGGILNGNCISGIPLIDCPRLGQQSNLPEHIVNDAGRNRYFMLPLLLGLAGLLWQIKRDIKYFWVVLSLFFMTGIAIVIYLNQTPLQARERDYAYAGSFYAFAIWTGLGVIAVYSLLRRTIPEKAAVVTAFMLSLSAPLIMAQQNYRDHDRSGRYTVRNVAYNYLNSCAPNAILFTIGDNDTFPLWYLQEVEGIRTDVRVVNAMLLNADWYISQMKQKVYDAPPLDAALILDSLPFRIQSSALTKGQLMVLRIIAANNRERPVYWTACSHSGTVGLDDYLQLEGAAYRLVPVRTPSHNFLDAGRIDSDILYERLMKTFRWDGVNDPKVRLDSHHLNTLLAIRARYVYTRLAMQLLAEDRKERAAEVLNRALELFPASQVPYDYFSLLQAEALYKTEMTDIANTELIGYADRLLSEIDYFYSMPQYFFEQVRQKAEQNVELLGQIINTADENGQEQIGEYIKKRLEQ